MSAFNSISNTVKKWLKYMIIIMLWVSSKNRTEASRINYISILYMDESKESRRVMRAAVIYMYIKFVQTPSKTLEYFEYW